MVGSCVLRLSTAVVCTYRPARNPTHYAWDVNGVSRMSRELVPRTVASAVKNLDSSSLSGVGIEPPSIGLCAQSGSPRIPPQGRWSRAARLGGALRRRRRRTIAASVTARLLSAFSELGASTREQAAQPIDPLTEREEEVLVTVACGRTNAEIADDLHISLSTVKSHLASLMSKLGARNRVELAMWAYETDRMPTD